MSLFNSLRIIESSDAAQRLAEAAAWLESQGWGGEGRPDCRARPAAQLTIWGAAGGRLVGRRGRPASIQRRTARRASCSAGPRCAGRGARDVHGIRSGRRARRHSRHARGAARSTILRAHCRAHLGFPGRSARTLHRARARQRVARPTSRALPLGGLRSLRCCMERFDEQFAAAEATNRCAAVRCRAGAAQVPAIPPVAAGMSRWSRASSSSLVRRLIADSPDTLVTVPFGDLATLGLPTRAGHRGRGAGPARHVATSPRCEGHLFAKGQPPVRQPAGEVMLFSAPGEGRECVGIVRRVLDEARGGVPFDEMAVFLRAPRESVGLLGARCARGGIAAWFDRGTGRPDPSGRAFVAMLWCAVEGFSAERFEEYLSVGRFLLSHRRAPAARCNRRGRPPTAHRLHVERGQHPDAEDGGGEAPARDDEDAAIVEGTLRSPWKWEELIVESAVIGGAPREAGGAGGLDGLADTVPPRSSEEPREEPESPRLPRFEPRAGQPAAPAPFRAADHRRARRVAGDSRVGRVARTVRALAPACLNGRRACSNARPGCGRWRDVGPVTLEEARDVLHDRLRRARLESAGRRYGRGLRRHSASGARPDVPGGVRARACGAMLPQRPREDPLLLDARGAGSSMPGCSAGRSCAAERLLLEVAIGAARRAAVSVVSAARGRRRCARACRRSTPSTCMRAITGAVPDHRVLAARGGAAKRAQASHGRRPPIPIAPSTISSTTSPCSGRFSTRATRIASAGHAHYLLGLNDALRRSVVGRWARGRAAWCRQRRPRPGHAGESRPDARRDRLRARTYSLSALQRFATCPYQFLLSDDSPPRALGGARTDRAPGSADARQPVPRSAGRVLARAAGRRPAAGHASEPCPPRSTTLERRAAQVAGEYEEKLAPAIERVWSDEIEELGRDLGIWVTKLADTAEWVGEYFEFSFGLNDDGTRSEELKDPVLVDGRFLLHGSVDLIERQPGPARCA